MNFSVTKELVKKVDKFVTNSVEIYGEGTASFLATFVSDTLIGQAAPGFVTTALNYKLKRTEKMILSLIDHLNNRITNIENMLVHCTDTKRNTLKEEYFPLLFDYAADEKQEDKITYIVNGFESVIERSIIDQDTILTYYDILHELKISEIKTLLYIPEGIMVITFGESREKDLYAEFETIFEEKEGEKAYIINKLVKLGLVITKKYMDDGESINYGLNDLKLTKFGKDFLDFFKFESKAKDTLCSKL
ncbi:MAG: hypothetical protein LLG02_14100 [Pelosinus sp.]|nr:hypothetical protein [Pelosinus sp.]